MYLKPVLHLLILAEEWNDTKLTKNVERNILAYLNKKWPWHRKGGRHHTESSAVEEIKTLLTDQQADTTGILSELQQQNLLLLLKKKDFVQLFQKAEQQQYWLQQSHSLRQEKYQNGA